MTTYPNLPQRRPVASRLFAVVSLLFALCLVPLLSAQENPGKKTYDIPADDAERALKTFAHQSGLEVLFVTDATKGVRTLAVKGEYTPREAIDQLLAGTPLTATQSGPTGAFKVRREKSVELAEKNVASRASRDRAADLDEKKEDVVKLETFEVFGRKTLNMDIRRTQDDPQPYVTFNHEELQRSQASDLDSFLRTRLPMNYPGSVQPGRPDATSRVDLRGLGSNQTLILVDGKRLASVAVGGIPIQPDINGIPLSAVERIEILPSTAGGIYGGRATGGVLNVILKREYKGGELSAQYGNTFQSDVHYAKFDVVAGATALNGKVRLMAFFSHSESGTLSLGDRDFSQDGINLTLRNKPDAITGMTTPPLGGTANILSRTGNLVLKPQYGGQALGSNITFIPLGYAGPASDNGAGLIANAGKYNLDLPGGLLGKDLSLITAPTRDSLGLNARIELTKKIEYYFDLNLLRNRGLTYNATSLPNSVTTLPTTAPNNPFQQAIRVRFPTPGIAFENTNQVTTARGSTGVITELTKGWRTEFDLNWSQTKRESSRVTARLDPAGLASLSNGLPAPDGRPALNVLQEANTYPFNFAPYFLNTNGQLEGPYITQMIDVTARVSVPEILLPKGKLQISANMSARQEATDDAIQNSIDFTTGAPTYAYFPHNSQSARAAYIEIGGPIWNGNTRTNVTPRIDLQASLRHDRYVTTGTANSAISVSSRTGPFPDQEYETNRANSTNLTVGAKISLNRTFALRGNYGTGFLPPSVAQISSVVNPTYNPVFEGLADPKRGGTSADTGINWTYISGGNPNLRPERSTNISLGAIVTPQHLPGVRFSIDYTIIRKTDEIIGLINQTLINLEDALGRVKRGPKLPGDPTNWSGPITGIDATLLNIATSEVEALDLQLDMQKETQTYGLFTLRVVATWAGRLGHKILSDSALVDRAGFNDGPVKWRGNAEIVWEKGSWLAAWSTQFYGSYYVFNSIGDDPIVRAQLQGTDRIPSQCYHDFLLRWKPSLNIKTAGRWLNNTEWTLGVQNIWNAKAPTLAIQSPSATSYSAYGDPRLRRYTLSSRFKF